MNIQLNIIHPYFKDALRVNMKWTLSFIPRIGETINPWLWIEDANITKAYLEEVLTEDGIDDLNKEDLAIKDWLYEVGIASNCICDISYYKDEKNVSDGIAIQIFVNEDGVVK